MLAQTLFPYAPVLGLLIVVMIGFILRARHQKTD
jgi:hypothetical protein